MKEHYKNLKITWSRLVSNQKLITEFLISIFAFVLTMMIFSKFTMYVELRKGIQFQDPLHLFFQAIDLTNIIFVMIYAGILFALIILVANPIELLILFQAYTLMVLTRTMMMYVLPLAPPIGMVLLNDPFVEFFGSGKTLVNDLFFSGHTATSFLLYLSVPKKYKKYFLILSFVIATSVFLQKTHYTVDILVAPFVSYTCYSLAQKFFKKRHQLDF